MRLQKGRSEDDSYSMDMNIVCLSCVNGGAGCEREGSARLVQRHRQAFDEEDGEGSGGHGMSSASGRMRRITHLDALRVTGKKRTGPIIAIVVAVVLFIGAIIGTIMLVRHQLADKKKKDLTAESKEPQTRPMIETYDLSRLNKRTTEIHIAALDMIAKQPFQRPLQDAQRQCKEWTGDLVVILEKCAAKRKHMDKQYGKMNCGNVRLGDKEGIDAESVLNSLKLSEVVRVNAEATNKIVRFAKEQAAKNEFPRPPGMKAVCEENNPNYPTFAMMCDKYKEEAKKHKATEKERAQPLKEQQRSPILLFADKVTRAEIEDSEQLPEEGDSILFTLAHLKLSKLKSTARLSLYIESIIFMLVDWECAMDLTPVYSKILAESLHDKTSEENVKETEKRFIYAHVDMVGTRTLMEVVSRATKKMLGSFDDIICDEVRTACAMDIVRHVYPSLFLLRRYADTTAERMAALIDRGNLAQWRWEERASAMHSDLESLRVIYFDMLGVFEDFIGKAMLSLPPPGAAVEAAAEQVAFSAAEAKIKAFLQANAAVGNSHYSQDKSAGDSLAKDRDRAASDLLWAMLSTCASGGSAADVLTDDSGVLTETPTVSEPMDRRAELLKAAGRTARCEVHTVTLKLLAGSHLFTRENTRRFHMFGLLQMMQQSLVFYGHYEAYETQVLPLFDERNDGTVLHSKAKDASKEVLESAAAMRHGVHAVLCGFFRCEGLDALKRWPYVDAAAKLHDLFEVTPATVSGEEGEKNGAAGATSAEGVASAASAMRVMVKKVAPHALMPDGQLSPPKNLLPMLPHIETLPRVMKDIEQEEQATLDFAGSAIAPISKGTVSNATGQTFVLFRNAIDTQIRCQYAIELAAFVATEAAKAVDEFVFEGTHAQPTNFVAFVSLLASVCSIQESCLSALDTSTDIMESAGAVWKNVDGEESEFESCGPTIASLIKVHAESHTELKEQCEEIGKAIGKKVAKMKNV